MTEDAVYLYAIGEAALAQDPTVPGLTGVDGAPVRVTGSGALTAAVSTVNAAAFSEEALRCNFDDLAWVEATARAHHAVVDTLAQRHCIAPVRLATIYHTDDGVHHLLDHSGDAIMHALERLRGCGEWGVKAFRAAEPEPGLDVGADPARPGTAYLLRRRAARDHAATMRKVTAVTVEQAYRELAEHAVASRRYPTQDPRLTGRSEEMLLNAAYLIDLRHIEQFRMAADQWEGQGLRLELAGPWPAYSFTAVEQP